MKTTRSLFLFFTFFLVWSVCAADVVPRTITADSTTQVLTWPTNLFLANTNKLWEALGGDETGIMAVERGGTGTNIDKKGRH